jgi:hypothetical protein
MKIRFQRHGNPTFEYVCFGFQHHFISRIDSIEEEEQLKF